MTRKAYLFLLGFLLLITCLITSCSKEGKSENASLNKVQSITIYFNKHRYEISAKETPYYESFLKGVEGALNATTGTPQGEASSKEKVLRSDFGSNGIVVELPQETLMNLPGGQGENKVKVKTIIVSLSPEKPFLAAGIEPNLRQISTDKSYIEQMIKVILSYRLNGYQQQLK